MYRISTMDKNHIIFSGYRGCGKSEFSRKLIKLSPQQYQEECEKFNTLIAAQLKQRLQQESLFKSIMMSYYEELNRY
jgi:tRNA uridine 5-carbamoylmethylation protein Kti12